MKPTLSALRFRRRIGFTLLIAVAAALLLGSFLTRGGDPSLEYNAAPSLPDAAGLVNQQPLQTARALAALAATPQEQEYARQAVTVADHEVDQAFDTALRDAARNQPKLTGETLQISEHIGLLAQHVKDEQQHLAALQQVKPKPADAVTATQNIEVEQAHLALDQDELDDLQQALLRAGGDRRAKIQQALNEHEAIQHQAPFIRPSAATVQMESPAALRTLPGKLKAYSALRSRRLQLDQARQDALNYAAKLTQEHDALGTHASAAPAAGAQSDSTTTALTSLRSLAAQRKAMAELESRAGGLQQLAAIYQNWSQRVHLQERTVLHRIFRVGVFIVVVLLVVLGLGGLIRRMLERHISERRRMDHLRVICELTVQVCALLLILLVIFGPPQHLSTMVGLITAGVAVVMKDFIIAFLGWFLLMGKNGLRVGDWVEINGVRGEVAEITLMRTVMLEISNWDEGGQPTGRRVAFMNGYAIEGQFFNFSTASQWLWDELHITVPAGEDSHQKIEQIREAVEQGTSDDSKLAEAEWQRATRNYGVSGFSADPTVDLRPSSGAIDVVVRYVTRAEERYNTRTRLYQKAIEILHFAQKESVV